MLINRKVTLRSYTSPSYFETHFHIGHLFCSSYSPYEQEMTNRFFFGTGLLSVFIPQEQCHLDPQNNSGASKISSNSCCSLLLFLFLLIESKSQSHLAGPRKWHGSWILISSSWASESFGNDTYGVQPPAYVSYPGVVTKLRPMPCLCPGVELSLHPLHPTPGF